MSLERYNPISHKLGNIFNTEKAKMVGAATAGLAFIAIGWYAHFRTTYEPDADFTLQLGECTPGEMIRIEANIPLHTEIDGTDGVLLRRTLSLDQQLEIIGPVNIPSAPGRNFAIIDSDGREVTALNPALDTIDDTGWRAQFSGDTESPAEAVIELSCPE